MSSSVFIVILSWNNYQDTKECLDSVLNIRYSNFTIVLVDNGSTDNSINLLKEKYSGYKSIHFIENKNNQGFTGGNNRGIEYALSNQADFVCLLNNDTIVQEDFLKELIKPFYPENNLAITTPKIYCYYRPKIIWSAGGEFNYKEVRVVMNGCNQVDYAGFNIKKDCSFATGCAVLIRSNVFMKIGLFDETLFHSAEDLDFCLRVKASGYRITYCPSSHIWHKVMASTGKNGNLSPLGVYYEYRNLLFVLNKFEHLKPIKNKIMITLRYFKALLVYSIKRREFLIFLAICFSIRDFFINRKGEASINTVKILKNR